ncbi:MAG: helix-turn-helix domain-containing protein [Clostridia bacterium]|nr:helix-turn-helix domain-containing protein [Clostridia bacterium]
MKKYSPEILNKVHISDIEIGDPFLQVYWIRAARSVNRDTLNFRYHRHTFFELHFITEGWFLYGFGDRTVRVERGSYILIPPEIPHKVAGHSEDFVKIAVAFVPGGECGLVFPSSAEEIRARGTTEEMKNGLNFVLRQAQSRTVFSRRLLKWRLHELIYLMAEEMPGVREMAAPEIVGDDRLLQAKKYVEDNPGLFFTCAEVAEFCHISAKQLGRLFEKYEKQSLLSYIHHQKAEQAKIRLLTDGSTQKSVSEELGFSSVQYFHRFFLRMTGMSPGAYIQQNRES